MVNFGLGLEVACTGFPDGAGATKTVVNLRAVGDVKAPDTIVVSFCDLTKLRTEYDQVDVGADCKRLCCVADCRGASPGAGAGARTRSCSCGEGTGQVRCHEVGHDQIDQQGGNKEGEEEGKEEGQQGRRLEGQHVQGQHVQRQHLQGQHVEGQGN